MKKVLILITELSTNPTADEKDVLDQALLLEETLAKMNYSCQHGSMGLNMASVLETIIDSKADIVFNLVESINGKGELVHIPPTLFKSIPIPYTGSGPEAMMLTSNKQLGKKFMESYGISTPVWFSSDMHLALDAEKRYIIKPLFEDASVGIDDNSVFFGSDCDIVEKYRTRFGKGWFIEEFIEGREFNISVIGGPDGPTVLPPAEIIFTDYPEDKPNIVGYEAKWESSSFEYNNTPRTFEFNDADSELLENLRKISTSCWNIFDLKGYARVDFRVDKNGLPYVLEINANPCLSPDSGFFAATERAGMDFTDVIARILNDCS